MWFKNSFCVPILPPATKLGQGYVFTRVCDSVHRGACVVARGGMCGCLGVCVVAGGAWLPGGVHGWGGVHGSQGVCMVAGEGSVHGCLRGHVWLLRGMCGCGGHAWLPGGMRGFLGGMCGCWEGCVCRIRWDTVNERAVRILLECILFVIIIMIPITQWKKSQSVLHSQS